MRCNVLRNAVVIVLPYPYSHGQTLSSPASPSLKLYFCTSVLLYLCTSVLLYFCTLKEVCSCQIGGGRGWVSKVRHLRAICQHSHQHTLSFTPALCKKMSLCQTTKNPSFLLFESHCQCIFSDMNSASKVGEIFLAAGTAYSKLGEVNHLYHLTSCGTTKR